MTTDSVCSTESKAKSRSGASTTKPRNIIEKIWDTHLIKELEGHPAVFGIDLMLIHEVTSAQAFQMLDDRGLKVFDRSRLLATIDHSIPTRNNRYEIYDEMARAQVDKLRENCQKHGIPFFDFDSGSQGIVHVIGPELGVTQPAMTIVCGDSHTSTHGAFGAIAFGIGTSEVGHVLATGCILQFKPKTMKVEFKGRFRPGVFAKDAVLALIAEIGIGGANGHIIEYVGDAVSNMTMEERMTVCNMSIECGARAGLISPDQTTFAYIKGRKYAPKGDDWDASVNYWESFIGDSGCRYDQEVVIDLDNLHPMITWGTNPGQAIAINKKIPTLSEFPEEKRAGAKRALEYTHLHDGMAVEGVGIDWAFVGSCTNGRIEDLRIAAEILKGKKIAANVTMYVVPGSEGVRAQAQDEGLDKIFEAAGAQFRMPGCSMCLAMNDDKVPPGKRCVSTSNRNFVGRQGPDSITHLASPATVAASALAGKIVSPESFFAK
jgi:3-isopropylmalate/(R)-2-methylmalate dehydratase large subunit